METETKCIATVGHRARHLCVADLIEANIKLRTAGVPGPFEYRLTSEQGNDVEAAFVAMPDPSNPERKACSFRGVPVRFSNLWVAPGLYASSDEGEHFVAILSVSREGHATVRESIARVEAEQVERRLEAIERKLDRLMAQLTFAPLSRPE